jgi:hypothetical protein
MAISAPGFSGEPLPMPPYRSVSPVMPEAAGIAESIRAHRRVFGVLIVFAPLLRLSKY